MTIVLACGSFSGRDSSAHFRKKNPFFSINYEEVQLLLLTPICSLDYNCGKELRIDSKINVYTGFETFMHQSFVSTAPPSWMGGYYDFTFQSLVIQLQTRGGPTNFTIAKTCILENRGGGRSLRDTHSSGWSSFLRNPTLGN